jgi:hypothetical protein
MLLAATKSVGLPRGRVKRRGTRAAPCFRSRGMPHRSQRRPKSVDEGFGRAHSNQTVRVTGDTAVVRHIYTGESEREGG